MTLWLEEFKELGENIGPVNQWDIMSENFKE